MFPADFLTDLNEEIPCRQTQLVQLANLLNVLNPDTDLEQYTNS